MSYVDETLLPNETVLYRQKPHYIVFGWPLFWLVLAIAVFIFGPSLFPVKGPAPVTPPNYNVLALLAFIIAAVSAVLAFINYSTSEFAITNKRVLMKVGFIRRVSIEIYLQKVESVRVVQSVTGRLLNYGSLIISGVGGSKDPFPDVPNPLEFRRLLQEQVEKIK